MAFTDPGSTPHQRPLRASWRDFPEPYIAALRETDAGEPARLGPMSWNDARFAQREFYRLISCLRRNVAEGDTSAGELNDIAQRLRVSCPRCDDDPTQHWLILRQNPIMTAMKGRRGPG